MTQTLSREHRKILENTAAQARAQAESGAEKALKALAVGAKDAPVHATESQKKLRVRLRAHGRALGDQLRPDDTQAIDHLVTEIAYEHWHRMLFARFLAESDLLMHPDGYPVSLNDCKEDAESFEPPARSEWEVAGHYASRMLPNVFRPNSPALAIQMPMETEQALEAMLAKLPITVFQADDSLGWSYQFWQAPKKEAVQRQMKQAGTKVGAEELPAVTQLFTEQYMVAFQQYLDSDMPPPLSEADSALRDDPAWVGAALAYLEAKRGADAADDRLEAARKALVALSAHPRETGGGVSLVRLWKQGAVDYKRVPELKGIDLDRYRGQGREEVRVTVVK